MTTFTCVTAECANNGLDFPAFEFPAPGHIEGLMFTPPTYCGVCGAAMEEQDES